MFHKQRFLDKTKNKQRRSIKWFFIKFHKKLNGFKLEHIHPEKYNSLTSGGVQYIGGYHDHIGGFSVHRGEYHEYIGGNIMSTSGDIMTTLGDIMSTSGDVQYIGVFKRFLPTCSHTCIMISPDVLNTL